MISNKILEVLIVLLWITFSSVEAAESCGNYKECDEFCCDVQACKETHHNLITTQNLCTCKDKSKILTTIGGAAKCEPILEPKNMANLFYLSDMECLAKAKCGAKCCKDHQKCQDKQCVEVNSKDLTQLFYFVDKECSSGKSKCSEVCCEEHQECKDDKCQEVKAEELAKLYYFNDKDCSAEKPKCKGTCCEDYQKCKENQCVEVKKEDLAKLYYLSDLKCSSKSLECNGSCCQEYQECKQEQCIDVKAEDLAKLYHLSDKKYSLPPLKCNEIYCLEHQKCQDNQCLEVKSEDLAKLYFFMDKLHTSVTVNCNEAQCAENEICEKNQCKIKQEEPLTSEVCKNKCDKFCCQEPAACNDILSYTPTAINNCSCLDTSQVLAVINGIADCRAKVSASELTPLFNFNDLCCDAENPNCDLSYCDSGDLTTTSNPEDINEEIEPTKCSSDKLNCNGFCCEVHQECQNNLCVNVEKEIFEETKCLSNHTVCSTVCCAPNVSCHHNKCICQRGFTERYSPLYNVLYCEQVIVSKTPYIVLGIGCILFALSFSIYKVYGFCRSSSYVF